MKKADVSRATIGRIPIYLKYLKTACADRENISATALAKALGMGEVQVRKDLASVSGAGRPKTGYNIFRLVETLESFLKPGSGSSVVIIGAGKLGRALLGYGGFSEYGLNIAAAFDKAVEKKEENSSGKVIYPMSDFKSFMCEHEIKIGIITVPAENAQQVCDLLVENGIRAIWCFAPCVLSVPDNVEVRYENMALSLAYLNKKIQN